MSKIIGVNERPPADPRELAAWFAEAVHAELAALEKDGGSQTYEIHSGKLVESKGPNQGIMVFLIADGTRIPEDTSGRLKTQDGEFAASVIGQQGNIIHLNVEGKIIPENIHFAKLIIDDTALLRKLAEVLEECSEKPENFSPLAVTVFHPSMATIQSKKLPDTDELVGLSGQVRKVLEQACGSSVTYIWGPPGTGKTYAIAHLVTALIESGQRVLVSSHTNAAVDQALYESVKTEDGKNGPLTNHSSVGSGQVLRIGAVSKSNTKIPDSVRFDKVLEVRGQEIQEKILETQKQIIPISKIIEWGRGVLAEWSKLTEFTNRLNGIVESVEKANLKQRSAEKPIAISKRLVEQRIDRLKVATLAWFRRKWRMRKAQLALEKSKLRLQEAEKNLANVMGEKEKLLRLRNHLEQAIKNQQEGCDKLPNPELIQKELARKSEELKPLEEKLAMLQAELANLAQTIVNNALAVFCTLTKSYVGKELEEQKFDAVIIDEISMALPPLIFLAAGRAKSRVILVGDFLQLPPIVRSDTEISNAILGKDTFHLAGVAVDLEPSKNCQAMTRLDTQHRMLTEIADVARQLVYQQAGDLYDDETVKQRNVEKENPWLDFLPKNPLIIVDTADLFCWSGKQPGTLSRFNMYSAMLSVEIAAIAARKIKIPSLDDSQPIGIISPFAAQRRLMSKLISDMELDQWVAAGTVHTFQGNQADLIIFDSVLDEPYFAARLSNPKASDDVRRELNVAVTRARNKFVFVGSSEWLNKHAKPASALGYLWSYLKGPAVLLSALDFVGSEFRNRIASVSTEPAAWDIPKDDTIQVFDETSFFDHFAEDINAAKNCIFALAPYFGEYRWPNIQPLFSAALARNIEVTVITPPLTEAPNKSYTQKVIMNLRALGAVVVTASGIHGKDVIIDETILYTGSMNWSSHRGRIEIMHRINAPKYARQYLEFLQAKHIRQSATNEDGTARLCPKCGWSLQIVNQRLQHFRWDFQAMKIGCTNPDCQGYLRDIDERPPFKQLPVCQVDGRTKYRRVRRGRGEIWQCPKHPKQCERFKVIEGDP